MSSDDLLTLAALVTGVSLGPACIFWLLLLWDDLERWVGYFNAWLSRTWLNGRKQ